MIYLMQLLKMLNKDDKKLFIALFSDFKAESIEMGYDGNESELFNEMLLNHLGMEIEDNRQLESIVKILLDDRKFKALINTIDIMR